MCHHLKRNEVWKKKLLYITSELLSMTFLSYEYSSLNSGQWLPGIFCLKIFWLCSLFVHLDIQKNTSTLSFFYISVFTMHGNGFGRSPYIPKHSFLLTEIHIRMHVCTKKFFWRSFPYIYFTSN